MKRNTPKVTTGWIKSPESSTRSSNNLGRAVISWIRNTAVAVLIAAAPSASAAQGQTVHVGSMTQLRAAFDQGGDGDIVVLAAGTYIVDAPLKLKPGMQLVGQNRYMQLADGNRELIPETATILDGSQVAPTPATVISGCEVPVGTFPAPRPIVEDAGWDNRISGLTVRSASGIGVRNAFAPAAGKSGLSLVITDCVFENCRLGIAFNNTGCALSGAKSTVLVERSIFRNNQRGMALFNLLAHAATINATLRDNVFSGNTVAGVQMGGGVYGTDDAKMFVSSTGNRFELNNAGALLLNGWHGSSVLTASDRNFLELVSERDLYVGNVYGVRVQNALIAMSLAEPSSGNTTRVGVLGGTFAGNQHHLEAIAWADARPSGGSVGTENTVELLVRNTVGSEEATFAICSGSPTEPSNRVTVIGSVLALEHANDGVLIDECP